MSKRTNIIVGLYLAVLLVVPLALWGLGQRSANIENRTLTEFPTTRAASLADERWYGQAAAYFEDRLPLRDHVVRADAWIDYELAGDSPVDTVTLGDDGWLFLTTDFAFPCSGGDDPIKIAHNMALMARLIETSGRRPVLYVAPNKSSVYPEQAESINDLKCATAARDTIHSELERRGAPGYVDSWDHMEAIKSASDEPIYNRYDTHWNPSVTPKVVELLLEALTVDLWDPADVTNRGRVAYDAELPMVMGLPFVQHLDTPWIDRRGISAVRIDNEDEFGPNVYSVGPSSRTDDTDLTTFHDSFGARFEPGLLQYFEHSTFVHWNAILDDPDRGAAQFASEVDAAEAVIIESAERLLYRRFAREFVNYPAALAAALLDDLPSTEVDVASFTGDIRRLRGDPDAVATFLVVEFAGHPSGMIEATLNDRPADRLLPRSGPRRVAWDISRAGQLNLAESGPEIAAIRLVVIDHGGDE